MKLLLILGLVCFVGSVRAEDTSLAQKTENAADKTGAAVKEAAQDSADATKRGYRNLKDKTCHLVNGKMECAGQKVKHGVQNTVDKVKDKAND